MRSFIIFCQILTLISGGLASVSNKMCDEHSSNELRLKCDLLKLYDSVQLPTNGSFAIDVNVTIHPLQIAVEETESKVTITLWISQTWNDGHLVWKPEHYGGLKSIHFDCAHIWSPSFTPVTQTGLTQQRPFTSSECNILSNGTVSAVGVQTVNAFSNEADYSLWPYDKHFFDVVLYISQSPPEKLYIKYNIKEISNQSLLRDNKWLLERIGEKPHQERFEVILEFFLTRHHSVHSYTYIYPSYVLTLMILSFISMNVLVSERLLLCGVAFLIQNIYIEYFMFILPIPTTDAPYIGHFHKNLLLLNGLIIVWTILSRLVADMNFENHNIIVLVKWIKSKYYLEFFLMETAIPQADEMENDGLDSLHHLSLIAKKKEQLKICIQFVDKVVCSICFLSVALLMISYHPVI